MTVWPAPQIDLRQKVEEQFHAALNAYEADPKLIVEHYNQEESFRTGGYSNRQIFELVQNAADAVHKGRGEGRIEIILIDGVLYCANEGQPFNSLGVDTVTHAYLSSKRDDEIGRFGLGFKSILSLSDHPQIFSRSVSFEFNAQEARQSLEALRVGYAGEIPRFRVPTLLDAEQEFQSDRVLAELSTWASTVVKIPIEHDDSSLIEQLEEFSTEFLLFAESVNEVEISIHYFNEETEAVEPERWIHSRQDSGSPDRCVLIYPNGIKSTWLKDSQMVAVDDSFRRELGDSRYRDKVKITYAAPIDSSTPTGRFWSFFPLQDKTSVSGILNAPWSVNDDRTTLLHSSQFNRMLLKRFVVMFVRNLHHFSTADDPARHFDYLPSRAREVDNEADRYLSVHIPAEARSLGIIPNLDGTFSHARDLTTLKLGISVEPMSRKIWADSSLVPRESPHPTCFTSRARSARFEDLVTMESGEGKPVVDIKEVGIASWLTRLGQSTDFVLTLAALKILDTNTSHKIRDEALMAAIIPLADGRWAKVNDSAEVLIPTDEMDTQLLENQSEFGLVDPELVGMPEARTLLKKFGFEDVDRARIFGIQLDRVASSTPGPESDEKWTALWNQAEEVSLRSLNAIIQSHLGVGKELRIMSQAGTWEKPNDLFDTERLRFDFLPLERRLHVDGIFGGIAHLAGVVDDVVEDYEFSNDELRDMYFADIAQTYRVKMNLGRYMSGEDLSIQARQIPGPIHVLSDLSNNGEKQALIDWSERLLRSRSETKWQIDSKIKEGTIEVDAPHIWALKKWGMIKTSWGPRPSRTVLSPSMVEYGSFLPVAKDSAARQLGLCEELAEVPGEIWEEFLQRDAPGAVDSRNMSIVAQLDVVSSRQVESLGLQSGNIVAAEAGQFRSVPGQSVYIATDLHEQQMVRDSGHPYLYLTEIKDAQYLMASFGAKRADEAFAISVIIEGQNDSTTLGDMFSGARGSCKVSTLNLPITLCRSITRRQSTPDGTVDKEEIQLLQDGIYYAVDSILESELLLGFAQAHRMPEASSWCQRVLAKTEEHQRNELIDQVKSCYNDVDRIRLLFAPETLKRNLPRGLIDALESSGQAITDDNLADIYFHAVGYRALEDRKAELESLGLSIPKNWAGSDLAIAFVSRLGFDKAFAGESNVKSLASEAVLGRPTLNDLHDYQVDAKRALMRVLRRGLTEEGSSKAMIELPTGSGKTRVAVESAVSSFLDEVDPLSGPILWIAQTEELCEQAVETWSEIWRAKADNRTLTINRLWSTHEIGEPSTQLSVVIATDAKLVLALEKPEYQWLREPSAVFVDEAHKAADSPRYGTILKQLKLDRGKTSRPLIGLSATPFKGRNQRATESLAARFGRNLVKSLGDDPIGELQRRDILARVRRESLEGGRIEIKDSENGSLGHLATISKDSLESLGENVNRNLRIVDHISSLDPGWSVLVFTPSVASAHVVAALLKARGIEAKAVSGQTPRSERSRIIDGFRQGSIRVLTNCDVLTHGFDAPKVRALYVAKPTLSPGVYMQMVGRGLRGVENGGSEECLIVDIEDTLENAAYDLAYREFEDAWTNNTRDESEVAYNVG